jgi:hypothetical protein
MYSCYDLLNLLSMPVKESKLKLKTLKYLGETMDTLKEGKLLSFQGPVLKPV